MKASLSAISRKSAAAVENQNGGVTLAPGSGEKRQQCGGVSGWLNERANIISNHWQPAESSASQPQLKINGIILRISCWHQWHAAQLYGAVSAENGTLAISWLAAAALCKAASALHAIVSACVANSGAAAHRWRRGS